MNVTNQTKISCSMYASLTLSSYDLVQAWEIHLINNQILKSGLCSYFSEMYLPVC